MLAPSCNQSVSCGVGEGRVHIHKREAAEKGVTSEAWRGRLRGCRQARACASESIGEDVCFWPSLASLSGAE